MKSYFQQAQMRDIRAFRYEYKWQTTDTKCKRSNSLTNSCLPDM